MGKQLYVHKIYIAQQQPQRDFGRLADPNQVMKLETF